MVKVQMVYLKKQTLPFKNPCTPKYTSFSLSTPQRIMSVTPHPQAHEQTEEVKLEAVQDNNVELVTEILGDISSLKVKDDSAAELSRILQEPHFQVSVKCVWW